MSEVITAIYEKGVLRPLQPLDLREQQTVYLQLLPTQPTNEAEEVIQLLVAAGLLTPPSGHSEVDPVSEEERRELAETLGKAPGKPLSEIVIEDRGER